MKQIVRPIAGGRAGVREVLGPTLASVIPLGTERTITGLAEASLPSRHAWSAKVIREALYDWLAAVLVCVAGRSSDGLIRVLAPCRDLGAVVIVGDGN